MELARQTLKSIAPDGSLVHLTPLGMATLAP
jgi:hypothetical protein